LKPLRTAEALVDHLAEALAWRKVELSRFEVMIQGAPSSDIELALCRAGVVMTCAHWEGFVKEAAQAYLNFVACQRLSYRQLNASLCATALKSDIVNAGQSKKTSAHLDLTTFVRDHLDDPATIDWHGVVATESNLSSAVFADVLATVGFPQLNIYQLRANFIDAQLLEHRHAVAHGERRPASRNDFDDVRFGVQKLLDTFRDQVEDAAVGGAFRA
jgi:MAE_28990/MAE_18760-like HEPN